MPSRLITGVILLFWLTMTGLLIHRELVPMMLAEVSPVYQIQLTDEIGSAQVHWVLWSVKMEKGKEVREHIGDGDSKIQVNDDRTYDFRCSLRFKENKFNIGPVHFRRIENMYRVTEEGKLLSLAAKVQARLGLIDQLLTVGIKGEVVNDVMEPHVFWDNLEQKLDKIDLAQQGSILNPMHPMNWLRGLHKGQTWKITMFDPLRGAKNQFVGDLANTGVTIPALIAEVKTDKLTWQHKEVDCFKIEYYEPGKDVSARTWVRRSDGLVLQQDANHFGYEIISERKTD